MARIITNQARINYRFGTASATAVSNITSAAVNGSLELNKTALNNSYRLGDIVTYVINIKNNGGNIGNIVFSDNLGAYTLNGNSYIPLTYLGNVKLFINGVENDNVVATVIDGRVEFTIVNLPANANAQIIYEARVNNFAPIECNESIVNKISSICECICGGSAEAETSIVAECYADVRIVKSVCPNPITCGEELKYTIDVYNYGNIPADDIVLIDTFAPPLTDISVSVDDEIVDKNNYTYINGTLTLPSSSSAFDITVPSATFGRNTATGELVVTPGHIQIIITGTL